MLDYALISKHPVCKMKVIAPKIYKLISKKYFDSAVMMHNSI